MPVALRWLIISAWASALLMGGSAADDPLQQTVTFDQPAQSVRRLLQALSRQTGIKLFAFQFVRALTPEQLTQLQAGKTLTVADLKPPQRALLNHEIYEVGILIDLEHEGATRAGPSERLCQLPHAFYPDGLPPDTTLKLASGDSSLGLFTERKLGVWGVCRSLDNIASEMQIVESFQSEESDAALPEYAQEIKARYAQALMPARFQLFTLEVRPAARRRIDLPMERWRGFGDHEPLTNTSAAPLDKLPADFKQKLEEAKRRLKEGGETDD